MSYTIIDAQIDEQMAIESAIQEGDETELRKWSHHVAEKDPEAALELLEMANRIARERHAEDWAYDESIEN